jgi:AraC family transcriptional regulator of adaptative response/methylated-DNA-[protein]-cysteine methyltransferase
MIQLPSPSEMRSALRRRDREYDGVFYFGVRTTGVFCRPSCSARKPLARNVQYFPTVKDALFAGFRACKRCHPLDVGGGPPPWVERLIKQVEAAPQKRITDAALRRMGVSPERARRWFSTNYGMTFHAFARGWRLGQAFDRIKKGEPLDNVVFDTGYESHSGFREAFGRLAGAAPGKSQAKERVVVTWIESPVGPLIAGATDDGVCLLEFSDRRMLETQLATLRRRVGDAVVPGTHKHLDALRKQLAEYFEGKRQDFDVPLVYPGSDFQVQVWNALRRIPYGETRSYEGIATAVGSPRAVRAVGTANGLNRIAIVIPCHRVVNKSGALGGYGGGLWRKQLLLDLERGQGSLYDREDGAKSGEPQTRQRQPATTAWSRAQ